MSADVGTDLEIIQALDFEESKQCEFCKAAPATHLMVNVCCGASILICDPHMLAAKKSLLVCAMMQRKMQCNFCRVIIVPDATFIPLGGAS